MEYSGQWSVVSGQLLPFLLIKVPPSKDLSYRRLADSIWNCNRSGGT
jgi:hypothetical protein